MVCCAAASCAVFSCVLSCCVAAPLARCCVVLCWRACVVPLCCALLCCFAPACLLAVLAACPPPPGVGAVPCALWCCRAVLPFRLVFCGAVLPCSVLRVVVWCPALLCCGLLDAMRCSLCHALGCCSVLWRISGRVVRLPFSRSGLLSGFAVCCHLRWCGVSLGAVPRCSALCCAVVCCAILVRSFCAAACCVVPSGAVGHPGVLRFAALCFVVIPRAVCSVLCVHCSGVVLRAVVRCCALRCGCFGVSCCAFPVLTALCGAVLRCAGAPALCCLCGVRCFRRPVLWCFAVCCAVACHVLWRGAGSARPRSLSGGVFRCRCPCLAAWLASLWLVWLAAVPCSPVLCSVVLCYRVVLCCRALLYFCSAVCACCCFSL